jgi:hypothetical protein
MKRLKLFLFVLVMGICSTSLAYAVDMGEILSAETRTGSITNPAQTDSFTFNGEADQTAVISMSRESGVMNPEILLYDPDGILEISDWGGTHVEIIDHQLLKSGTYTIVVKDWSGNYTGDYSLSFTKLPGAPSSPSMRLILNQNEFVTGDTLTVSAHIVNGPDPVNVEVKIWVHLPSGDDMSILDPHFTFTVEPNADFTTEIFSYTFDGSEPSGDYNAGGRFLNPISGRELSVNVESFSFSP